MSSEKPTGSVPANDAGAANANANANAGAGFDDVVGKEQPANKIEGSPAPQSSAGEKPDKPGTDGKKPDAQPAAGSGDKGAEDKVFWGKFKSADEAKVAYEEAERKITEQGQKLSQTEAEHQNTQTFLTALDKALAAKPELADQLKAALAAVVSGDEGPENTGDAGDESVEATVKRILDDRETQAKAKSEIDSWFEKNKEELNAEDGKLGHEILDRVEQDKLPFNAKTLQLVFDALTGDKKAKKAAEDALKKEEVADLDREEASAVGGGTPASKGKVPQGGFDALVGGVGNPNRL